jgi:hypothetical protein
MRRRRSSKRPRARAYAKENPTGIEWLLIGLGVLVVGGIAYVGYEAYQINSAYMATLPPGTAETSAGMAAWLQTPAGIAAVQNAFPGSTPQQVQQLAASMAASPTA